MSTRTERPTGWFKLSTSFYADEKIMKVGKDAELLFLRMLALASGTSSGGRISSEQALHVGRRLRSVRAACEELVAAGLLAIDAELEAGVTGDRSATAAPLQLVCSECDAPLQHECSASAARVQRECGVCAAPLQHQCSPTAAPVQDYRIVGYHRWNLSGGEPPAQSRKSSDDGQGPRARPPARERKTERKTETVTSRPASPDGRDVTGPARDAPRSAGGAAQRTPDGGAGMFAGPVRVQPDFAGPRRVADSSGADTVAAKVDARAKLEQFIRQFPQHGNSSNANGQDPILAWDAVKESDGGDTE